MEFHYAVRYFSLYKLKIKMERRAGKVRLFQLDSGFPLALYWRKQMETGRQYADGL